MVADGYNPQQENYGLAPQRFDPITYDNILPPSPRDQVEFAYSISPYNKTPRVPLDKDLPKGRCYMGYRPLQGIPGVVCGGLDNSNFNRGNIFSVDYNDNAQYPASLKYMENAEYLYKHNPMMVDQNPFYPIPDLWTRDSKWFKTYPYDKQYMSDGQPFYTFPYSVINSPANSQPTINNNIEGFSGVGGTGGTGVGCQMNMGYGILLMILILVVISYMRRR